VRSAPGRIGGAPPTGLMWEPILGAPPIRPTACARLEDVWQYIFRNKFDEVETIDGLRNKVSPHFP